MRNLNRFCIAGLIALMAAPAFAFNLGGLWIRRASTHTIVNVPPAVALKMEPSAIMPLIRASYTHLVIDRSNLNKDIYCGWDSAVTTSTILGEVGFRLVKGTTEPVVVPAHGSLPLYCLAEGFEGAGASVAVRAIAVELVGP